MKVGRPRAPRGRVALIGVALAGIVMTGGCSVATDPARVAPSLWTEEPTLSAAAQQKGAADARAAALWAQEFVIEHSFDERFIDPGRPYTEDQLISAMQGSLSQAALTHWHEEVTAAAQGDETAADNLNVLTYVAPRDDPLTVPSDGDPVRSQQITDVAVGVDPQSDLFVVDLHYGAQLELEVRRNPVLLDASKNISLTLSAAGATGPTTQTATAQAGATSTAPVNAAPPDGAWVIESYEGELTLTPR